MYVTDSNAGLNILQFDGGVIGIASGLSGEAPHSPHLH